MSDWTLFFYFAELILIFWIDRQLSSTWLTLLKREMPKHNLLSKKRVGLRCVFSQGLTKGSAMVWTM